MSPLKGGRGPRLGQDAVVNQREADIQRAYLSPLHNGIAWGTPTHLLGAGGGTTVAIGADTLYLTLVVPPAEILETTQVRARSSGAAFFRVSLYHMDPIDSLLTLVPGSEVTINTSGAGQASLQRLLEIAPSSGVYWIGLRRASAAAVTMLAVSMYITGLSRFRTLALPYTAPLPGNIPLTSTTASGLVTVPVVSYVSQRWASLL